MTNRARVFLSKAEDLLPRLPADSFDSIVCDPPYGLEFMGRAWDKFTLDGSPMTATQRADHMNRSTSYGPWGRRDRPIMPNDYGHRNEHCLKCGKWRVSSNRCQCSEPEWEYRTRQAAPPSMLAFQAWCETWARECFRVLKPGGHLVAFGGTRTYHRLACAIEDAGFEIRDSLHWMYGSGFPKGLDVSKAIDKAAGAQREVTGNGQPFGKGSMRNRSRVEMGYRPTEINSDGGTVQITAPATEDAAKWSGWNVALKPAHEPIILARKPLSEGTVAANVLRWGTGALNVDGCKVAHASGADLAESQGKNPGRGDTVTSGVYGADRPQQSVNAEGRWPPNLLLTHSADCRAAGTRRVSSNARTRKNLAGAEKFPGCYGDLTNREDTGYGELGHPETVTAWSCAPGCPVAGLDAQSGVRPGFSSQRDLTASNGTKDVYGAGMKIIEAGTKREGYNDTGGASRFFPAFTWSPEYDLPFLYQAKAPKKERPRIVTDDGRVIQHPTIKPLSLCRWLVRLVTPPGGTVGDFFTGTGPVVQAALDEGMRCVACDQDPDSVALSRVRLAPYAGVRFTVPEPAGQPDAEAECG